MAEDQNVASAEMAAHIDPTPPAAIAEVRRVAEKVLQTLASHRTVHGTPTWDGALSLGVAELEAGMAQPEHLIETATARSMTRSTGVARNAPEGHRRRGRLALRCRAALDRHQGEPHRAAAGWPQSLPSPRPWILPAVASPALT